ncbi:MAG: FAD-dependent monooxygenase [Pirellulaceae bacterium]
MAPPELGIPPTLPFDEAGDRGWDVVVIGAGPAGAMAAREAALAGARVLLADRASFPRQKVCGCCLNGAAIGALKQVGLGDLLQQCQARTLHAVRLASAGRFATVQLSTGVSLSRARLDAALIRAAIAAGAEFLDQTQALIGDTTSDARRVVVYRPAEGAGPSLIGDTTSDARCVILKRGTSEKLVSTKTIVVAGGLGCRVFAEPDRDERHASRASRVGAGTILDFAPAEYGSGTVYMACHRHGYVGLVRLEDNRLDVAAALDADAIKQHGGIAALVDQILTHARLPVPADLNSANWHGTGRLTQHREQVVAERCFFIGDAAGYVEPFTGEGIAAALASGRAVTPIVLEFLRDGRQSNARLAWTSHQALLAKRARLCRYISRLLRSPALMSMAVRVLAVAPSLAHPVLKALNASFEASLVTSATARVGPVTK